MTTSAKQSAVRLLMMSLLLLLMLLILGVSPYNARQMASKMVVLPAPVCPVMAKIPASLKLGLVKSICQVPTKEFRFFRVSLMICMMSLALRSGINGGKVLGNIRH